MLVNCYSTPPRQQIRPDLKTLTAEAFEQGALTAIERSLTSIPSSRPSPLDRHWPSVPGLDPIQAHGDCAVIVAIQNFNICFTFTRYGYHSSDSFNSDPI
jgi:hypothetical protein